MANCLPSVKDGYGRCVVNQWIQKGNAPGVAASKLVGIVQNGDRCVSGLIPYNVKIGTSPLPNAPNGMQFLGSDSGKFTCWNSGSDCAHGTEIVETSSVAGFSTYYVHKRNKWTSPSGACYQFGCSLDHCP